jgi:hypothetical protein
MSQTAMLAAPSNLLAVHSKEGHMLDANTIVTQVRAGTGPASWQVLRPQPSYFMQGAIGGVVLLVAAVAAAAYLLLSGTVVGYGLGNQTPEGVLTFWLIADLVVLVILAVGGIALLIGRLRAMGTMDEQLLVLTPEGYLMRTGAGDKQTALVDFQRIAPVQMAISNGTVYLLCQQRNTGRTIKQEVDSRFGKPKIVAQQILALSGQFAHAHPPSAGLAGASGG